MLKSHAAGLAIHTRRNYPKAPFPTASMPFARTPSTNRRRSAVSTGCVISQSSLNIASSAPSNSAFAAKNQAGAALLPRPQVRHHLRQIIVRKHEPCKTRQSHSVSAHSRQDTLLWTFPLNDQVRVVTRSLSRLEVVRADFGSPRLSQDESGIAKNAAIVRGGFRISGQPR